VEGHEASLERTGASAGCPIQREMGLKFVTICNDITLV
jgi:hypothetical protein